MGRPTNEQARDTRREILDSALDLFAEHGFRGTSMRALAGAVGVRESAIYHHFESKEALLAAVLEDHVEAGTSALESDLGGGLLDQPLDQILSALAQRFVVLLQSPRHRKFLRIAITAGVALDGEDGGVLKRSMDEPRRALSRMLAHLKKAGKVRPDVELDVFHLHMVAPLFLASNIAFSDEGKGPFSLSLGKFVKQHIAFMVQALAPPRGR